LSIEELKIMTTLVMAVLLQASVATSGEKTYAEAYHQSAKSGRPLVVMLGADWCPACVKLKKNIMPQVAHKGGLKGVELAYVDVDKEPALAKQLVKGGSIPQLVRFEKGPKGWESKHMIGAQSVGKVTQFVSGVPTPTKKPFSFSLGALTRSIGLQD
jgi:thioredoxin-like negative regulator of GroEL